MRITYSPTKYIHIYIHIYIKRAVHECTSHTPAHIHIHIHAHDIHIHPLYLMTDTTFPSSFSCLFSTSLLSTESVVGYVLSSSAGWLAGWLVHWEQKIGVWWNPAVVCTYHHHCYCFGTVFLKLLWSVAFSVWVVLVV